MTRGDHLSILQRVAGPVSQAPPADAQIAAAVTTTPQSEGRSTSIDLIKTLYRDRPHAVLYTPFCKVRDVLAGCRYLASTDGTRLSAAVAYTQDSIEFAWALPGRGETLRNLIVQARHRLRQVAFVAVMETGSRSWSQVLDLPILGRYYRAYLPAADVPAVDPPGGYEFAPFDVQTDAPDAARLLNEAYPSLRDLTSPERLRHMAAQPYHRADCWFFLRQTRTRKIVGIALGGLCDDIGEGFIDWVEVQPRYRGRGLGRLLILELIRRLSQTASLITASGSLDAPFVIGNLYERCGFTQSRQWTVLGEGRRLDHHDNVLFIPPARARGTAT